jgi:hypothetical protein
MMKAYFAHRAAVGLCILCALALGAVAAESASAVTKGTTAFTCLLGGVGQTFAKEHCRAIDGPGSYGHFSVAENTTTELKLTNEKTNGTTTAPEPTLLKEIIGGVELELEAPTLTGFGTLTNKKDAVTGEHYIEGTVTYAHHGMNVKKPAGKGCKVFEDAGGTKGTEGTANVHLDFTTKGQGHFFKFTPAASTKPGSEALATFFVECTTKVPAIEGTWELAGSFKCPVDGATIRCSHTEITTENTLKGKGNKAGIAGPITILGKDPIDPAFFPLSVTTVETP